MIKLNRFLPLSMLSKDELKQREVDIQRELATIAKTKGSNSEAFWDKQVDLEAVQSKLYTRFNTVGEEMTKGARS